MKRTVLFLLLSLLLIPVCIRAEAADSTEFDLDSLAEDAVFLASIDDPTHAILGIERNADAKRYPASTTKILTCIVALENGEPDEPVTVSKHACNLSEKNSKMGLKPNERYPLLDLLYGLMLPSGNDAAIAIAEHIGGSVSGFADLMNRKAAELGMTHSHFTNPHGLHNDNHYSTARDMALLSAYAMQNETFRTIVSCTEYTAHSADGREIVLHSSNRLLRDATAKTYTPYSALYDYAIGIKTGDTHLAGKCLVAAAQRSDTIYLLVLLRGENAPAGKAGLEKDKYAVQRFYDAIRIFDYAFRNDTVTLTIEDLMKRCLPETYAIELDPHRYGAKAALYRIEWDTEATLTLPRWQAGTFALDPFPEENLQYSIRSYCAQVGTKAGTVSIAFENEIVFTADLIVEEYEYPPTPEPTAEPVYEIIEVTPEPTVVPEPSEAVGTETPVVEDPPFSFWSLLRCNPNG